MCLLTTFLTFNSFISFASESHKNLLTTIETIWIDETHIALQLNESRCENDNRIFNLNRHQTNFHEVYNLILTAKLQDKKLEVTFHNGCEGVRAWVRGIVFQ